jgi:hypothetical protein
VEVLRGQQLILTKGTSDQQTHVRCHPDFFKSVVTMENALGDAKSEFEHAQKTHSTTHFSKWLFEHRLFLNGETPCSNGSYLLVCLRDVAKENASNDSDAREQREPKVLVAMAFCQTCQLSKLANSFTRSTRPVGKNTTNI